MFARPLFHDRFDGGRELARHLVTVHFDTDALVLALPRGGVPVGFEVALALHSDLDVFLVRKLGVPGREELAMGAIASGGIRVLNYLLIKQLGLTASDIDRATLREQREIERRESLYREDRPPLPIEQRTVILVDDGLATGASMLAAARAVRAKQPQRIVIAVPVASSQARKELGEHVDDVICAETPEPFRAVGVWYEDFSQTSHAEVGELLRRAARERVA